MKQELNHMLKSDFRKKIKEHAFMKINSGLHNMRSPPGISFTVFLLPSKAGELVLMDWLDSSTNASPQAWCLFIHYSDSTPRTQVESPFPCTQ